LADLQSAWEMLDVVPLQGTDKRIATVEVVKGSLLNTEFISPDTPGRWKVVGFGTLNPDYAASCPNSMILSILNLEEGKEVRAGIGLVEAT